MGEIVQPGADGKGKPEALKAALEWAQQVEDANPRESLWDWVCRCGVRNRIYVKVCGGCGFSDTGQAVAHANGAYSCIAHTLGGGEDADDFWYEQARDVLEALKRKGLVVVKAEGKP